MLWNQPWWNPVPTTKGTVTTAPLGLIAFLGGLCSTWPITYYNDFSTCSMGCDS